MNKLNISFDLNEQISIDTSANLNTATKKNIEAAILSSICEA